MVKLSIRAFFFWEKNEDKLKEGKNEKESGRQQQYGVGVENPCDSWKS